VRKWARIPCSVGIFCILGNPETRYHVDNKGKYPTHERLGNFAEGTAQGIAASSLREI